MNILSIFWVLSLATYVAVTPAFAAGDTPVGEVIYHQANRDPETFKPGRANPVLQYPVASTCNAGETPTNPIAIVQSCTVIPFGSGPGHAVRDCIDSVAFHASIDNAGFVRAELNVDTYMTSWDPVAHDISVLIQLRG
jgi:hypothetical protein